MNRVSGVGSGIGMVNLRAYEVVLKRFAKRQNAKAQVVGKANNSRLRALYAGRVARRIRDYTQLQGLEL